MLGEVAIDHKEIIRQAAEMIAVMTIPDALWTTKECAVFLRVSVRHFGDRLAAHPDFPAPVHFPSDKADGRPERKWRAAEVKAWALANR